MVKKEENLEINKQKILSSIMDVNELTKLQKRFSSVSNLFTFALSGQGNQLTTMTGPKEQGEHLRKSLGSEVVYSAYHRVLDNPLEDMIIEDTQFDNIKIGAVAIRVYEKLVICWIVIAVLEEMQNQEYKLGMFCGVSMKTTYQSFLKSMDLLQYMASQLLDSQSMLAVAEAETTRMKLSEERIKKTASRSDLTTRVVQFLERTDAIENVFFDFLKLLGEYLDLDSAHIFRLQGNRKMEVICEWYKEAEVSCFDRHNDVERLSILRGDKTSVISSDTKVSIEDQTSLDICNATAIICAPIIVQKTPDIYALFVSRKQEMIWIPEDVRLVNDSVKIVQNIMIRKIQKNSLAVSYQSLEAILDNVGSAVVVVDSGWNRILFANHLTKTYFERELEEERLMDLIRKDVQDSKDGDSSNQQYDIYDHDHDKWYEVDLTKITWVDGSLVELYAVYDITEKKEYQKHIEKQAYTDFLTGLNNRLCCERDLATFLEESKNDPMKQGAVIYIDLDNFKQVNDSLGHEYGDILLKSVAAGFRSVKGLENTCYRMGGDEFIIVIPKQEFSRKEKIVEQLQDIFRKPFRLNNEDYYCTMSMGMVYFPSFGTSMQELVKRADFAMYKAKKSGKNRIAVYELGDEEMEETIE